MASPELPNAQPLTEAGPGVGAGAWLGSRSVFDAPDPALRRRSRNANIMSFGLHAAAIAALIIGVIKHKEIAKAVDDTKEKFDVVYLEAKGPGGGGGGS